MESQTGRFDGALESWRGLGNQFWVFWTATFFFTAGLFAFSLLHDLYLFDRGFNESFLGTITAAHSVGNMLGALPAGWLAGRLGLRRTLILCFCAAALAFAARVTFSGELALPVLSFVSGSVNTLWFVSLAPAIARLTTEKTRSFAYSVFFASSIGIGVIMGIVAGRMPEWLLQSGFADSDAEAKQTAILLGCGCMLISCWPAAYLKLPGQGRVASHVYPRGPFIILFAAAIAPWYFATGFLNPFFDAYLARHQGMSVKEVGMVFSAGQFAQILAILCAPYVFRRFGTVKGIMAMQVATGLTLGVLWLDPGRTGAAAAYWAYAAFQWMSEPGLFALLMSCVARTEQSGASAINFLVLFGLQAAAGAAAGSGFARFGYPPVLGAAGVVAVISGLLFGVLLRRSEPEPATGAADCPAIPAGP